MEFRKRATQGIQAGLLAGFAVAAVFFVADLVRLAPLSTPAALQQAFVGPGGTFLDLGLETRVVALIVFGVRLLSFTILHLLAFAVLGVGAAFVLGGRSRWVSVCGGALYGLVVCSVVFYGSMAASEARLVAEIPDLPAVAGANLLAGTVMGLYLSLGSAPDGD